MLQNGKAVEAQILRVNDLLLDSAAKKVFRSKKSITLTKKEFELLEYFMKNAGQVLSRALIAQHVWGISFDRGTNFIDVYVNYLRNKIDKDFSPKLIHTIAGAGYIFKEEK